VHTYVECIPCFLRQTLDVLKRSGSDHRLQEDLLRRVLKLASEMDLSQPPPAMAQIINRLVREVTGDPDPYLEVKKRLNGLALKMLPRMRRRVEDSADRLETAVRLAAAGNIIDLGAKSGIAEAEVARALEDSLQAPMNTRAVRDLAQAAGSARSILYLGDNAGEIVLDRLLVEELGTGKVTFAVRGSPTINDATMADAAATGMTDLVEVIDNGSDAPGTILGDCSRSFRRNFRDADLVLAKGQGNYETLSEADRPVFFLLMVKCPVVAADVGCAPGSLVLRKGAAGKTAAVPRTGSPGSQTETGA